MSGPDGKSSASATLPFAVSCSVFLISRVHSSLFSDWRRTVSSKFFDPQVPSISTEELVLPRHASCVLSRLRCNGHSFLLSLYLSWIGRIENPFCSAYGHWSQIPLISFCTVQLRTLRGARFSATPVFVRSLVQALECCPASVAAWSSAMPPSGNNNMVGDCSGCSMRLACKACSSHGMSPTFHGLVSSA